MATGGLDGGWGEGGSELGSARMHVLSRIVNILTKRAESRAYFLCEPLPKRTFKCFNDPV